MSAYICIPSFLSLLLTFDFDSASPTKNPSTQTLSRPNHVQVIDLDASELPEYDDVEM